MTLAALALIAGMALAPQGDPWAQIWTELETLRAGGASTAEAGALAERLTLASREGPDDPRRDLLRAALESYAGRDVGARALRLSALRPDPFGARERWILADLLPTGPERAAAVLRALESPAPLARWQVFLAWNTALDAARALRYEEAALPIQEEMHRRYQADWSALDLCLSSRALGRWADARRVLEETIAREEAAGRRPAALWEHLGVLALGAGDDRAARDYLGRALAWGSPDAGLLLSRMDLDSGNVAAARRGFRALILDAPPPDWAWRGWGTALLPAAFAAPLVADPASADPIARTAPHE
jgi:hypothetical protein